MARIQNGQLVGKVGNVVYYRRNGKVCVRIYKKQKDANTLKQQIQRAKMRVATTFLTRFRKILDIGYQNENSELTEFGEALSYHMHNALIETLKPEELIPSFEIDFSKVLLSRGNITKPEILNCVRDNREITLIWDKALGARTNRHHDVMVLVAYTKGIRAVADFNVGTRKTGEGTMKLPAEFKNTVHLWAFYHNGQRGNEPNKDFVSDSVYLGEM